MDCNGLLIHHLGPKFVKQNDLLLLKFEFILLLMIRKTDSAYARAHWLLKVYILLYMGDVLGLLLICLLFSMYFILSMKTQVKLDPDPCGMRGNTSVSQRWWQPDGRLGPCIQIVVVVALGLS